MWLPAIALAVLFTAFQIRSSLYNGTLALPVTYDDVMYFNQALTLLDELYRRGGAAWLMGLWANPPHAPLHTSLAMLGFATLGREPWAAYATNALPLTFIVRLFLGYACMLPQPVSIILAAALLGFPLFGVLVLEFRPDMLCALLTAAGALILAIDPSWRAGKRRTLAVVAALFVGALLAKPTLSPVTVTIFGAAVAALLVLRPRIEARSTLRSALISGGIGALVVAPYYVPTAVRLYNYIFVNVFGTQASMWAVKLPWHQHALYYLTGPGGSLALGRQWLAFGAMLMIVSLPLLWSNKRATLGALAVGAVAYVSVTVPSMKSPFLGMVVPAFWIVGVVILILTIWKRLRPVVALALALALLLFSILAWRPVTLHVRHTTIPTEQSMQFLRMNNELIDAIAAIPDLSTRTLYFPVVGAYLNPDTLEFGLRQRGSQVPSLPIVFVTDDVAVQRGVFNRSQILVLFSNDSTLPIDWTPTAKHRERINAETDASNQFTLFRTIEGGPYKGSLRVMLRRQ